MSRTGVVLSLGAGCLVAGLALWWLTGCCFERTGWAFLAALVLLFFGSLLVLIGMAAVTARAGAKGVGVLLAAGAVLAVYAYLSWSNQIEWGLRECCNAGSIGPDLILFGLPGLLGGALMLTALIVWAVSVGPKEKRGS